MPEEQEHAVRQLVDAALTDAKAYAMLVRRFEAPLHRYVGRLLDHSRADIDDVLQETFLKAYVNLNDYDRRRAFSPWLYRIAHNEAMNALRGRRREPAAIAGEDADRLLAALTDGQDPQHAIDAERRLQQLHAAIAVLEPRYRDALVLRYLEELSYEEISDVLEIPMGTVATLINRGKSRLRRAFDGLVSDVAPFAGESDL